MGDFDVNDSPAAGRRQAQRTACPGRTLEDGFPQLSHTMTQLRRSFSALALVAALPTALLAQKRALRQADWDRWKSISGAALTNDGKWAAYSLAAPDWMVHGIPYLSKGRDQIPSTPAPLAGSAVPNP